MSLPSLPHNQSSSGIGPATANSRTGLHVSQLVSIGVTVILLFAGWSLFVIFGAGPALGVSLFSRAMESGSERDTDADASTTEPETGDTASPDDYELQLERTLLLVQQSEFEPRLIRIRKTLSETKSQLTTWDNRTRKLLVSDDGRRLANVESAVRLRILLRQCPLTTADLKSIEASVDQHASSVQNATKPLAGINEIDQELAATESRLLSSTARLTGLDAALDELQATAASSTPSGQTLGEFLDSLDERLAQERQQAIDSALTLLRERLATELANANQRKQDLEETLRAQKIEGEEFQKSILSQTEASRRQSSQLASNLAKQREAARIAMERELPSMRSLLSPFITPGYRQPKVGEFTVTIERQPVSYGALVRLGALEETTTGLERLLHAGQNDTNRLNNDRPLGSFPGSTVRASGVVEKLEQVQQFLKRHGEAMIEAKLLAP